MASHHASDRNHRPPPPGAYRTGPAGGAPRRPAGTGAAPATQAQRPGLSEQRFQDLLKDASRFFAQAEDAGARAAAEQAAHQAADQAAKQAADLAAKQVAITDILALMARHQLTVDDLS